MDEEERMRIAVNKLSEHLVDAEDIEGLILWKDVVKTTKTVLVHIRRLLE